MTKTETEILNEIKDRGYSIIEHGHGFLRHSTYGTRRINARNKLIHKGLVKIDIRGTEKDSEHGRSSISYWSRIISI